MDQLKASAGRLNNFQLGMIWTITVYHALFIAVMAAWIGGLVTAIANDLRITGSAAMVAVVYPGIVIWLLINGLIGQAQGRFTRLALFAAWNWAVVCLGLGYAVQRTIFGLVFPDLGMLVVMMTLGSFGVCVISMMAMSTKHFDP